MSLSHFLRIEREGTAGAKHYVVHTTDPQFSLELSPDSEAADKMGKGVLKRLCVPNSWTGDYTKYGKLMGKAQDFFAQSLSSQERPTNRLTE